jgi:cytochrome P450
MTEVLTEALFAIADGPQRHARYAELAATAPVHRIVLPTGQPGWLITGYEEVRRALDDPRLVRSEAALTMRSREPLSPEVAAAMSSHMLNRALLMLLWVTLPSLWVAVHDRPGSGGQRPPRVRSAMAMSESGLW